MVRLYIKQKVFSWRDRFQVKDENEAICYQVEGEIFSWGHKLHVYDGYGREVAYIQQKVFSWMPTYFIFVGGIQVAKLTRKMTLFRPKYILDGPDWQIEGNFWAHEYGITRAGSLVATLQKAWFTWGDSYALEVMQPGDVLPALCVTLALDCDMADSQSASS